MDYHIVLSIKDDPIDWTEGLKNITIYNNKEINEELETILKYIIDNYDNLPSYVITLNSKPFEGNVLINEYNFEKKINKLLEKIVNEQVCDVIPFFEEPFIEPQYPIEELKVPEYYYRLFDGNIPDMFEFNIVNQYIIPKRNILNRDKGIYMKLYQMLLNNKEKNYTLMDYKTNKMDITIIHEAILKRLFPYLFDLNVSMNPRFK